MDSKPSLPQRKPLRLKEYNYSSTGHYSITICTQNRECLFGNIINQKMELNDAGKMIEYHWNHLTHKFQNIELDTHVVMPNHLHGILALVGAPLVGARTSESHRGPTHGQPSRAATRAAPTVGSIIGAFKSITTIQYIRGVNELGWPSFPGKLWQRNYYEHIIRNEVELTRTRQYIMDNPITWDLDEENPYRIV